MNIGYLFAVLGALGSGTGSVLESVAIKRSGAYGHGNDELGTIARQPLYWTGVGIDILGFVSAAIALHRLPLFLVQSVMAFSVGVTATISAFLGVRLGRQAWWALGVSIVGLVGLALCAQPGAARTLPPGWQWILVAVVIPVAAIGFFGNRGSGRWAAPLLAFGAGLGFTAVAVSARTLHVTPTLGGLLASPGVWAIVVNGVAATAVFAMALQNGAATTAAAILFTTNTVLPSAIGLVLLGDTIRSGMATYAAIAFVLSVAGAIALAHFSDAAERRQAAQRPDNAREKVGAAE